jgi:uncharacterized repeat protein (TIGR02543 family)
MMRTPTSVRAASAGVLAVVLGLTGAVGSFGAPAPILPAADPPPGALALDRVFDVDSAVGDAQVGEYELTLTDGPGQASALWAHQQLDLAQPFHMQAAIHLGDEGADAADGITFTVQAENPTLLRDRGDRLGIYPEAISDRERRGVSVEFDTYFNGDGGDLLLTPPDGSFAGQHAAVVQHRDRHEHRSAQWVGAAENPRGLSDGVWKILTVSWDPEARAVGFALDRLDGTSILAGQGTIDLRTEVGDHAWWGFTGSTGALGSRNAMRFQEFPQAQSQAVSAPATTVTAGDQLQLMVEHEALSGRWDARTLVVDLSAFGGALSYVDGSVRVDGAPHDHPAVVTGDRVEVPGLGSLSAGDASRPAHSAVAVDLRAAPGTGTLRRAIVVEAGGADEHATPVTLHDELPLTITPAGYGLVYHLAGGAWRDGDVPVPGYTADDEVVVPDPVRTGHRFVGWTVTNSEPAGWALPTPGTGVVVPPGTFGDLAFTAHWSPEPHTIGFDLAGGTWADGGPPAATYTVEDEVVVPDPGRPGYAFVGWTVTSSEPGGWTVDAAVPGVTVPAGTLGDLMFTAHWSPVAQSIGFDLAGGAWAEGAQPAGTYTVEDSVAVPDPVRPGYGFDGWTASSTEPDGWTVPTPTTGVVVPVGTVGDLSLTAHWATLEQAITYDLAGGAWPESGAAAPSYTVEQRVLVPDPVRPGHGFAGWTVANDHPDGWALDAPTAAVVVPPGTLGDLAFTAHWSVLDQTIDFDLAGGAWAGGAEPEGTYTVRDEVVVPDPVRPGYAFTGWTVANDTRDGWVLDAPETGVVVPAGTVGSLAFTAHWSALAHAITYDLAGGAWADGETPPVGYTAEAAVVIPDPVRAGHVFAGWTATNAEPGGWVLSARATRVVVPAGTVGDLAFTAHWSPAAAPDGEPAPAPAPPRVPTGSGDPAFLPWTGAPSHRLVVAAIGLLVTGVAVSAAAHRRRGVRLG